MAGVFLACGDDDSSPAGVTTIPFDAGRADSTPPPSTTNQPDTGAPSDAGADADASIAPVNIKPSGAVGTVDLTTATDDTVLDGNIDINPDTGNIFHPGAAINNIRGPGTGVISGIGFQVVDQGTNMPKAGVFTFKSLTIKSTAIITVIGTNAVALASAGDLTLAGSISASGLCASNLGGPGGFAGGQPNPFIFKLPNRGGDPTNDTATGGNHICGGGGGGANLVAGGNGSIAASGGKNSTVNSGAAARDPVFLSNHILAGGSGGGSVVGAATVVGGPGGGALELFAKGAITVTGKVAASGCGGKAGQKPTTTTCAGAGGGGAGGTIFFEAQSVSLAATAIVVANGGGGGGGTNAGAGATDGANGSTTDATPAVGGTSIKTDGACDNGTPGGSQAGAAGTCTGTATVAGAGGGGSLGIFAARTASGAITSTTGAIVSPAVAQGTVTPQ